MRIRVLGDTVEKDNIRIVTGENVRIVALRGGKVEEFHVMAVPPVGGADAGEEATALYQSVVEALGEGSLRIVAEQLHGNLADRDAALAARAEVLNASPLKADNPVSAIDGKPCERRGVSGVLMTLVRENENVTLTPIHDGPRLCGYKIDDGESVRAYLTAMDGLLPDQAPGTPTEQAELMFRRTEKALQSVGLNYHKVVCTRIRMRRMLEWYDDFNAARNACYREWGILREDAPSLVPPSTGIQGKVSEKGECVMEVAVMTKGEEGCPFVRLRNPLQNEATDYGSAFARGGAVDMPDVRYVFVSGTASIDTTGASVHVGDVRGQVVKTIDNFDSILEVGGAAVGDLCQAIWYCKDPSYVHVVREEMQRRDWPPVPCLMTFADVCRADLLVEMEGLAVTPA